MTQTQFVEPAVIHAWSKYSVGLAFHQGNGTTMGGTASTVNPVANQAYLIPFWIPFRFTINNFCWYNGATAAGNVDAGVYTYDGTFIASTGSTAQSGTNTKQTAVPTTAKTIYRGRYWLAFVSDSATATFFAGTTGTLGVTDACGIRSATSSFALPTTTITPATLANDFVPVVCVASGSVI